MVGTSGPHQWSVEMWRIHVQGAKSYSRFRVDLELDSFWVMYGFEHVFSKLPVLWHVGKMCHVTHLGCEKSHIDSSIRVFTHLLSSLSCVSCVSLVYIISNQYIL